MSVLVVDCKKVELAMVFAPRVLLHVLSMPKKSFVIQTKKFGENCCAPLCKNFYVVFAVASAGRLTPAKDKTAKSAKKIVHRHCGVRLSYGITYHREDVSE